MAKKYSLADYKGNNWDDSAVIDKLPVKEVIDEYRRAGKSEDLIYGWCIWRRELDKYRYYRKLMGPVWSVEHSEQLKWNFEYAVLQDCRENGLMDVWLRKQKIANPNRGDYDDLEEVIEYGYRACGRVEDDMPPIFIPKPDDEEEEEIAVEAPKTEEKQKRKLFHRHNR